MRSGPETLVGRGPDETTKSRQRVAKRAARDGNTLNREADEIFDRFARLCANKKGNGQSHCVKHSLFPMIQCNPMPYTHGHRSTAVRAKCISDIPHINS